MKKIIVLLLMVFIISGCKQSGPEIPSKFEGKEALRMQFAEDFPPERAYEGDTITIGLQLANEGAQDIKEGVVRIWTSDSIITSQPVSQFSLDGLRSLYAGGVHGLDVPVFFEATAVREGETVIRATGCYKYETVATGAVCIEKFEYKTASKPSQHACNAGAVDFDTQGAPVAVEKAETKEGSNELTIYIGIVSDEETQRIIRSDYLMENCRIREETQEKGRFTSPYNTVIPAVKMGETGLECEKNAIIKEEDAEELGNQFRCKFNKGLIGENAPEAVLRPIEIVLSYGVLLDKTKKITVEKRKI